MWHMITSLVEDLHRSTWTTKLCLGLLVLLSSFSVGSLGALSVQTILNKWRVIETPMPSSGSDSAISVTKGSDAMWKSIDSEKTWTRRTTISKLDSGRLNVSDKH